MLGFLTRRPGLGLEISSGAIRLAALSGSGVNTTVLSVNTADLPAGMVNENYAMPNIQDADGLAAVLRGCLSSVAVSGIRRAALSLPDEVFRVQTLEFDELPVKSVDRERLIRWRLEKAAFDVSDTVLRYEVLRRQDAGLTVLACVAKRGVLSQYESVLIGLGLEPWSVGLSSFSILNFYSLYMTNRSPVSALACVAENSFTTIVTEDGRVRFYRFKELKRGGADDIRARLLREIEESLHFYTHMDRAQQTGIGRLYLAGEPGVRDALAGGLGTLTSLDVEILRPAAVLPSAGEASPEMAAALGAGGTI
jgi:Tfp pilus assembly PilM family ATPase